MLTQGQEIAAIDFADIIGGPLIAVINAQAKAANVTSSFIQQIAFAPRQGGGAQTLQTVSFDFSQMLGSGGAGGGAGAGALSSGFLLTVPLLSLLPIPFIRIDSMTLQFNVNLHNTNTTKLDNNFTFNNQDSANENAGLFSLNEATTFKASVTDQNTFQNNQLVDDTYSLSVTVHAVQDQMPGGLAQVLGIFGNLIQSQATMLQTVMTQKIQAQQAQLAQQTPSSAAPAIPPASVS